MGILAATLANLHRSPQEAAYVPADFMPRFHLEAVVVDDDAIVDQQHFFEQLTLGMGGQIQEGHAWPS